MKYKVLKKGGFFTDPVYDLYCDWDISDWGGGIVVHGFFYIPPESVRKQQYFSDNDKKYRASRRDVRRYLEFMMERTGVYLDWNFNPGEKDCIAYAAKKDIPEMYQ